MPPMTDARMKTGKDAAAENGTTVNATYNFAFLDEQTKRMIRRALLKAVAIPGYQVPFASREMPTENPVAGTFSPVKRATRSS